MTTWNNRVVKFVDVIEGETEEFYEIKEVFLRRERQAFCVRWAMPWL
jgi:hypothetical protein